MAYPNQVVTRGGGGGNAIIMVNSHSKLPRNLTPS